MVRQMSRKFHYGMRYGGKRTKINSFLIMISAVKQEVLDMTFKALIMSLQRKRMTMEFQRLSSQNM